MFVLARARGAWQTRPCPRWPFPDQGPGEGRAKPSVRTRLRLGEDHGEENTEN